MEHISAFHIIWSLLMKHNSTKGNKSSFLNRWVPISSLLSEASWAHQPALSGSEGCWEFAETQKSFPREQCWWNTCPSMGQAGRCLEIWGKCFEIGFETLKRSVWEFSMEKLKAWWVKAKLHVLKASKQASSRTDQLFCPHLASSSQRDLEIFGQMT